MTVKHTPGPWKQEPTDDEIAVTGSNGYTVAKVRRLIGLNRFQTEANACLIAAAPELLAALEEVLDLQTDDDGNRIILDKVRAVIAKAQGQ